MLGSGYGLKIDGLYCEKNNTSIRFEKGVGVNRLSGIISNSIFTSTLSNFDISFDDITNYSYLKFKNITSNVKTGKSLLETGSARLQTENINLYSGGKLSTGNKLYKQFLNYPVTQQDLGSEGISFEVPLQTLNEGILHNQKNKQFIFNAKFTYGATSQYSAHLTGILSMDGHYDEEIVSVLNVDVLSTRNTSGNANGNLENSTVFEYYFKESGTKTLPVTEKEATIVFKFNNGVYNNSINKNSLTFKPLDELLSEGMIQE